MFSLEQAAEEEGGRGKGRGWAGGGGVEGCLCTSPTD